MTVRHVFMWRTRPGQSAEEIVELLNTLPEKCPGIVGWEIGRNQGPAADNEAAWDGVLVSDHESWEALEGYSNHPSHLEVVDQLLPRLTDSAVVDFQTEGE